MNYDLDFIIKELSRRPHVALVGRDPQTKMYRVDWRDSHKRHFSRVFPDMEHAIGTARNLELQGTVVGFRVLGRAKPRSWVPRSSDVRLGGVI